MKKFLAYTFNFKHAEGPFRAKIYSRIFKSFLFQYVCPFSWLFKLVQYFIGMSNFCLLDFQHSCFYYVLLFSFYHSTEFLNLILQVFAQEFCRGLGQLTDRNKWRAKHMLRIITATNESGISLRCLTEWKWDCAINK